MKIFKVIRPKGCIIEGIVFKDGTTVLKWISKHPAINIYHSFEEFKAVHLKNDKSIFTIKELTL